MALLLPNPHTKQREFIEDRHRFAVLNWGRRSGKSVGVWEKVVIQGILRQGTYYIIAPTYKQAKSIYWREICKRYKGDFMTFNEQDLSITFDILTDAEIMTTEGLVKVNHDPNLPATRIELKGADNPESLRGVGLCGAVLDEYAFMPNGKYVYDTIIRPALADKNGWAVFISTPDGVYNHFYDLCQLAQRNPDLYYYSHATALDNSYFMEQSPNEFEDTRIEFEQEGKIDVFNQEWLAEFVNPSQLIYADFDPTIHVFNKFTDMPHEGTYCMTIDFGSTDPTAALSILIDYDGNWWVFDELYRTDLDLDQLVYALSDKMGDYHFARILGDSSAKFALQSLRKRGFRITGSKKGADSINNGIREVQSLLKIREGTGKPKLFVHSRCVNLIKEFQIYSWVRDGFGEISQTAEDKNNHALDALRYLALDKARAVKRVKRKREYDPDTGRALN
jgi:phage terminase large subunit